MPEPKEVEPVAIKSSVFLKGYGEEKFIDLARKDSFDVIITDPLLVVKNMTDTVAVNPDDLSPENKQGKGPE